MRHLHLAFLGFGNVGRAFARLLENKSQTLKEDYGVTWQVTGIATARHGTALNPDGLPLPDVLDALGRDQSLDRLHPGEPVRDNFDFIRRCAADIVFEITPLNPQTGRPALDHVRAALKAGLHVVTANKGPVAFAHDELAALAAAQKRAFRFEGAVLDGAPVFNLVRHCLPGSRVLGFRGVVNSTTNFILTAMEEGLPQEDALRQAQALGITEADPSYDLEGWDAAVKTVVLVNALMGGRITPQDVTRTGISHITPRAVIEAARQGRRFKLIAEAQRGDGAVTARVAPRMLSSDDPLAQVAGTSSALTLVTDTLGELTITHSGPEPPQTAYALLSDMLDVLREYDS